jgi:hypothetical protein
VNLTPPCTASEHLADESEPSSGPHVVNQVFTIVTGWGYAARCGCGWKTPHDTHSAAHDAGQEHMRAAHACQATPELLGAA